MFTQIISVAKHPFTVTFIALAVFLFFYLNDSSFIRYVAVGLGLIVGLSWVKFFYSSKGSSTSGTSGQVSFYADYYKRRNGNIRKEEVLARMRTEPVPATVGAGANSMIVMYWNTWGKLIWTKYGEALLGREILIDRWAEDRDYSVVKPAAPEVLTGKNGVPAAFADDKRRQVLYARNRVSLTVKGQKVTVADSNRFILPEDRSNNVPTLVPGTVALTKFPEEHALVVTPKNSRSLNLWISQTGMKVVTSDKNFDKLFDVYTDDAEWAAAVFTDSILDRISQFPDVRIIVDRGVLAVISLNKWIPVEQLDGFASLARVFSKVAFMVEENAI